METRYNCHLKCWVAFVPRERDRFYRLLYILFALAADTLYIQQRRMLIAQQQGHATSQYPFEERSQLVAQPRGNGSAPPSSSSAVPAPAEASAASIFVMRYSTLHPAAKRRRAKPAAVVVRAELAPATLPLWTGDHNYVCEICNKRGSLQCCSYCNHHLPSKVS